jgi:hypothetical protein
MERMAAFHRRQQPLAPRPGAVPHVTTASATQGQLEFPPFQSPELRPTRHVKWAMIGSRALMLSWAVVTALRIDAAADDPIPRSPSGTVTAIGWLIVAMWFGAVARWSWLRTTNVHRLEGRFPTRTRSAVVWVYPAIWVALMGVTLVPASPNPDFDYRPPIIVGGFILTMLSGYRIVHRIFKSLVRMPPTATCVAFYLVDVMAFGLIWWRVTSWTGRDGIAPLDADLDLGILVAASVALAVGMVITWFLDRAADRGQEIRLLALRTRYDHRMARLNGLDPMNPQTRYALMLARRAAERAAHRPVDERTPDAFAADDPLIAELARELELGITANFAPRIRELERRTDGMMPTRPATPAEPRDDASPSSPPERRLWLAELVRYLVVGAYAACAAAAVVLVVEFRRGDADAVDAVRRILLWGAAGVHVLVALWAARIAADARRFGLPALWRMPVAALVTSAVVVPLWYVVEVESDAARLGLFTVLTLGLELALWRVTAIDWLVVVRESDSPLEAWMSVAPFVVGLVLLSPMRTELAPDVSGGRVAFFATLIGLAAALSGGLAAVAMVQLEDALRATTPGDRSADAASDSAQPAPAAPAAPIERSLGTTRTPTARPRADGPAPPMRVDLTGMSAEVAAGLGIDADRAPATEAAPDTPATEAARDTPTEEAPVVKPAAPTPAAKKAAAKRAPAKNAAAKKAPATKAPVKKAPATKAPATKAPATETPDGAITSDETPAADSPVRKAATRKAPAKKAPAPKDVATKTSAAKRAGTARAVKAPDASEERPLALDADPDDGRAHEDAADPVHEVEGAADGVGGLGEHVDDPHHGEQDHDVPEPGDHADEAAGPGER